MRGSGECKPGGGCTGVQRRIPVHRRRDGSCCLAANYEPTRDCLTGGKLPSADSLSTTGTGLLVTLGRHSAFAPNRVGPRARRVITRGTA